MKSIVVLLILFCQCQGDGCQRGWTRFRDTDRCYYVNGNPDTFERANNYCKDRKAHLVPPLTCEEQIDLNAVLAEHRGRCRRGDNCAEFWIGIHNLTAGGLRTGDDFLLDKDSQCQYWDKGFPKPNEGKCILMSFKGTRKRGLWRNANCTRTLKFACITCPNGFDYLPEINECILYITKPVNWSVARETCPKLLKGAQLLTIKDAEKQEALGRYMTPILATNRQSAICFHPWWPGGGRLAWMGGQTEIPDVCKTPYQWKPVGAPATPFVYSNFFPGNPNCGTPGENCALVKSEAEFFFRWEDYQCQFALCYICEFY